MRSSRPAVAALLLVSGCSAGNEESAVAALEPGAAPRFQSTQARGEFLCGEINLKERDGSYGQYRRFIHDRRSNELMFDGGSESIEAAWAYADVGCSDPLHVASIDRRICRTSLHWSGAIPVGPERFRNEWASSCG